MPKRCRTSRSGKRRCARVTKRLPQRGRSNKRVDRRFSALKPGRRVSKTGKRYTETRANRSDKRKRL